MDETTGAPDAMDCWPSGASDVDQAIRVGEYLMLERLCDAQREANAEQDPEGATGDGSAPPELEPAAKVARALLAHFHSHTDSINLRFGLHQRYLMRRRSDRAVWDREAEFIGNQSPDTHAIEFVCLRRYGSFHPLMPRPAAVAAVGGGYLVRVFFPRSSETYTTPAGDVFNILVDPGQGVIGNLYRVGLAIADVDMIIASHDHPDHLAALDALLSLRHEHIKAERIRGEIERLGETFDPTLGAEATDRAAAREEPRMLILGNRSVVNRYSFLNGGGQYVVQHIHDASVQSYPQLTEHHLKLTSLPTLHKDLAKDDAVGFVLSFKPACARIAFMSDTAVAGIGKISGAVLTPTGRWEKALSSDIVVAHMSDAPSGELRELAGFVSDPSSDSARRFEETLTQLLSLRAKVAAPIIEALGLIESEAPGRQGQGRRFKLFAPGFIRRMEGWDHLYLHGLLAVARQLAQHNGGVGRVLVVGELREQLGSFRGTIAREINSHVFDEPATPGGSQRAVRALTADVGLRIRLTGNDGERTLTGNDDGRARGPEVYCSTCALDNDQLLRARYHPPSDIREVCVKGDNEAMYWNCGHHDPSLRRYPVFVEQMNRYDPLAGGGFHG